MPNFYASILRIAQMLWVWRATVEWYLQGKTEELGEKPVPVPLCWPQIPHGLTRARTRASAVRGRRLITWAMARPFIGVYSFPNNPCKSETCVPFHKMQFHTVRSSWLQSSPHIGQVVYLGLTYICSSPPRLEVSSTLSLGLHQAVVTMDPLNADEGSLKKASFLLLWEQGRWRNKSCVFRMQY
jgi:hypothetical protein